VAGLPLPARPDGIRLAVDVSAWLRPEAATSPDRMNCFVHGRGRNRGQARVPSAWDPGDVAKILEAVDRGSPCGKRDYAIILLASRTS